MMTKIHSIEEYKSLVKDNKSRFSGIERNSFLLSSDVERLILNNKMYYTIYRNGIGIYIDENSFYNLYFFWNKEAEFENFRQDKPVLIEILEKENVINTGSSWIDQRIPKTEFNLAKLNRQYDLFIDYSDDEFEKAYAKYCEKMCEHQITIRFCETEQEAEQVISLWKDSLDSTDLPEDHLHFFSQKNDSVLCAYDSRGHLAGAYWWTDAGRDVVEGRHIVVSEQFSRKGIATAILLTFMKQLRENNITRVITWISSDNAKSISLHQKIGFRTNGKICKQYILNA